MDAVAIATGVVFGVFMGLPTSILLIAGRGGRYHVETNSEDCQNYHPRTLTVVESDPPLLTEQEPNLIEMKPGQWEVVK